MSFQTASQKLEQRFADLCIRIMHRGGGENTPPFTTSPHITAMYRILADHYNEARRAYHTLAHIEQMLDDFDRARAYAEDPDTVEAAIWFHDIIYRTNIFFGMNEESSARSALSFFSTLTTDHRFIEHVATMIRATTHTAFSSDPDTQLLLDLDLSILGKPQSVFDRYDQEQIPAEYRHIEPHEFARKRLSILKDISSRSAIYRTHYFWMHYEAAARANLERSMKRLTPLCG